MDMSPQNPIQPGISADRWAALRGSRLESLLLRWREGLYPWLGSDAAVIWAALILVLVGWLCCERTRDGSGLGEDGQKYFEYSKYSPRDLLYTRGMDNYNVQRILPSVLVHYSLRFFSTSSSPSHVILAFIILNVIVLVLSAWAWCWIAAELKISVAGKWLGFLALFVNYAVLKWAGTHPVLTDMPGYALGTFMLYFYLARKPIGLSAVTLIGAFVWPSAVWAGGMLLLFPREDNREKESRPAPFFLHYLAAATLTLILFLLLVQLLQSGRKPIYGMDNPYPLLRVSMFACLIYVFISIGKLIDAERFYTWSYWRTRLFSRHFLFGGLFLLGIKLLPNALAQEPQIFGFQQALENTLLSGVGMPGLFLVSHVLHYGPLVLLAIYLWTPVAQLICQQGAGLVLSLIMGLILSISAESRFVFNYYPFLVAFVVMAADKLSWRPRDYAVFLGLSFLFSRAWVAANMGPFQRDPAEYSKLYIVLTRPYPDPDYYCLALAVVLVATYFLYVKGPKLHQSLS